MENQNPGNTNLTPPQPVEQIPTVLDTQNGNIAPKSKFPLAIIIGFILLLLIVGSATGFYVFKHSLKTAAKPTPTLVVQKPIPSPTPDPTANWKTYTNTKLGFEFKYPPIYTIESENPNSVIFSGTYDPGNQKVPSLLIINFEPTINLTLLKPCANVVYAGKYQCLISPTRELTINGILFIEASLLEGVGQSQAGEKYVIQSLNKPQIEFVLGVIGGGDGSMGQVLSTFKFTN